MPSTNPTKAAKERAKALNGRDASYITALEIERQGYVTRGYDDRVAAVDEQLAIYRKALGVKARDAAQDSPAEPAARPARTRRTARPQTPPADPPAAPPADPGGNNPEE